MYSAETTIVDVKQTGESEYTLSMTAKDLYVAAQSGDVLRRHDVSESDKAPEKKYVALSGVKFAEATGKYTFTFASGDVFESTSDTAYPTAESVSDEPGGLPEITDADDGKVLTADSGVWVAQTPASGGGMLVVTDTSGTLNKTVAEITAVDFAVVKYEEATGFVASVVLDEKSGEYDVRVITANDGSVVAVHYVASSASGYPELQA